MEGLDHFESSKGIEGFIPYVQIDDVYLAAGDPICAQENFMEFVHEFRTFTKKNKADCCFLSASEPAKHNFELMGFGYLKIGEEGIFDLSIYTFEGSKLKDVRYDINHARKEGVIVKRLEQANEKTFTEIEQLSTKWLNTRNVHGFSFLLTLNPLENFEDKIFFIAEYNNQLVGYLSCVPIYLRNGFYFEDLIRSPEAPSGTNQLMIYEAINYLKSKGYSIATLGTSPLGNIEETDNSDHKLINEALHFIYERPNGFYNFITLHNFKDKGVST